MKFISTTTIQEKIAALKPTLDKNEPIAIAELLSAPPEGYVHVVHAHTPDGIFYKCIKESDMQQEVKPEQVTPVTGTPNVPDFSRDNEPASMVTLVRGIADLAGGLNMLMMMQDQPYTRALAHLANELSRSSVALLEMHIRAEAAMAFRDGRDESPMQDVEQLWDAVRKIQMTLQVIDVTAFDKAKKQAMAKVEENEARVAEHKQTAVKVVRKKK